jgi:hypothetical protein
VSSPGTDRVGKHLGVYRDQFEKWMDGLMEWEATEKQCPASILTTACLLAILRGSVVKRAEWPRNETDTS